LAPFAAVYAVELKRRGYTRRTSVNQLRQVARLSLWVEASGLTLGGLTGERIDEFLAVQRATGRHRASWSRPGLVCLLDVLSGLGVLQAPASTAVDSPTDALLGRFERYLLSERGLAVGTVRGYVSHARRFVGGLSRGGDLGRLTAAEVTASVLREAAAGSVSAAQNDPASILENGGARLRGNAPVRRERLPGGVAGIV
jgi:integrase/recombinase XerD